MVWLAGVMSCTHNSSTLDIEAGGSQVLRHPELLLLKKKVISIITVEVIVDQVLYAKIGAVLSIYICLSVCLFPGAYNVN